VQPPFTGHCTIRLVRCNTMTPVPPFPANVLNGSPGSGLRAERAQARYTTGGSRPCAS
jgi:hypothetical protein